jgi:hypothetical protein
MHVRIVSEEMTKEYEVKTVSKPVPSPNTVLSPPAPMVLSFALRGWEDWVPLGSLREYFGRKVFYIYDNRSEVRLILQNRRRLEK